ncbi:MAG TPA: peptidase M23, partial [Paracoccus sp. (in: a-proteobacteria)]|nr:peptidase M23 [Paracoccus sp. (in: a-proteobacteria)]
MKFRLLIPLLAAFGVASMAPAQPAASSQENAQLSQAAQEAADAAEMMRSAIGQLDQALTEDDQVVALTRMIRAYEQGLSALRDGLRRAGIREQEIRADFDTRRERLGRVLGVMTSMQRSPETMLLLHPSGPESSARAGMILASVAPGLEAEARDMSQKLEEIRTVRAIQLSAANTLAQGLGEVQE